MGYVVDLLRLRRSEYTNLLDYVNKQLEDGNVFRSCGELHSAKQSKAHYEEVLNDIEVCLAKINK